MISAENLTRRYGNFVAVDDVSFSIPKGAIVGLLGHNGAGKTTIMKMLTGFLEPCDGSALINDLDVTKDRERVQQLIGYLPENSPLYPEMTVTEYLEYVAELRDVPVTTRSEAISKAISRTKLEEKAQSLIKTLSRGFKQRVGVAQAVLHEPEILVLDEPTNGLDPSQINDMRNLIKTLSEKSTVIISTHILQEVQAVCDRAIILSRGKLVINSSLEELTDGNSLLVESDKGASEIKKLLNNIKDVQSVVELESLNGNTPKRTKSRIELTSDEISLYADITKELVNNGCKLYTIMKEEKSLEAIFQEASSE